MLSRGYFWIHILVHFDILGWPPQELFKYKVENDITNQILQIITILRKLLM